MTHLDLSLIAALGASHALLIAVTYIAKRYGAFGRFLCDVADHRPNVVITVAANACVFPPVNGHCLRCGCSVPIPIRNARPEKKSA